KLRSRKKECKPNEPEKILTRQVLRQRIVPDWLWHKANKAIAARNRNGDCARGSQHPLAGISRNTRGPLSNLFVCFCGARMWVDGRNNGGYRCSAAKKALCWNKATALRDFTREAISRAVLDRLLNLDGTVETLVQYASQLQLDDGPSRKRESELRSRVRELERVCGRLTTAVESTDESIPPLVCQLLERRH